MRIAVIGAGVAGLGAAWLLSQRHDVTVFEKEPRLGGHANTVEVASPDAPACPVDTGFIVYNTANYPNLIALFDHLDVATAPTRMSFAVSFDRGRYEYSGSGLRGLFGQYANGVSPGHWRLVLDLPRFFRDAKAAIESGLPTTVRLGDWLASHRYSDAFVTRHVLPMGAAIWSTPAENMMDFPAISFHRFFAHHGLLSVRDRPSWRTVDGGSQTYVTRLRQASAATFRTSARVARITRSHGQVTVHTHDGASETFDACVMATHADEALALLSDADAQEARVLSPFRYAQNEAVLHRDPNWMPRRRRLWSCWNYLSDRSLERLAVSYWMNELQPLKTSQDWFVTLNPGDSIDADHVHSSYRYAHPMYDRAAIDAQTELWQLQGRRATWFCGSYFGYGFHEDALQSGLAVGEALGGQTRPWSTADQNDRLHLPADWKVVAAARQAAASGGSAEADPDKLRASGVDRVGAV